MKPLLNWFKQKSFKLCGYFAGSLILSGILMILPRSPWTLIAIGIFILFVMLVSLDDIDSDGAGPM